MNCTICFVFACRRLGRGEIQVELNVVRNVCLKSVNIISVISLSFGAARGYLYSRNCGQQVKVARWTFEARKYPYSCSFRTYYLLFLQRALQFGNVQCAFAYC